MSEAERAKFEKWISGPPWEQDVDRWSGDSAWQRQYKIYAVQLAWEAWIERAKR